MFYLSRKTDAMEGVDKLSPATWVFLQKFNPANQIKLIFEIKPINST